MKESVVILGASSDPGRYSYKCAKMLLDRNYPIVLVHPKEQEILNHKVYAQLIDVKVPFHTLTLYVNPQISNNLINVILNQNPKRVIMNPGSENDDLEKALIQQNIEVVRGCSLVMLTTGQF